MTRQEQMLEAFVAFHRAHPEVWRLLGVYVEQVKAAGLGNYGIAAVFERIRWHRQVEDRDGDYKLNNNFRAFYARMWMLAHPGDDGVFELRTQKSKHRRALRCEPGAEEQISLLDLIESGDVVVARLRELLEDGAP